jgi:uncharacterized membrane protein YqjE
MDFLKNKQLPRFVVSLAVLILYGLNPASELNQTLVTAVVLYWIGSSAGSFNKDERNGRQRSN